jgi:hypothetical protein
LVPQLANFALGEVESRSEVDNVVMENVIRENLCREEGKQLFRLDVFVINVIHEIP